MHLFRQITRIWKINWLKKNNTFFLSNHTLIQPEIMSYYSPKPSIIECRFCHDENSFEIHDGATFCMNCGNESKEHGQELVYEIQDLIGRYGYRIRRRWWKSWLSRSWYWWGGKQWIFRRFWWIFRSRH